MPASPLSASAIGRHRPSNGDELSTDHGRRVERSALERQYATKRSAMVPVYGRRRVGKTELLPRFIVGKPAVYFSATQKLRGPQIADLMRAAAAATSPYRGRLPDR